MQAVRARVCSLIARGFAEAELQASSTDQSLQQITTDCLAAMQLTTSADLQLHKFLKFIVFSAHRQAEWPVQRARYMEHLKKLSSSSSMALQQHILEVLEQHTSSETAGQAKAVLEKLVLQALTDSTGKHGTQSLNDHLSVETELLLRERADVAPNRKLLQVIGHESGFEDEAVRALCVQNFGGLLYGDIWQLVGERVYSCAGSVAYWRCLVSIVTNDSQVVRARIALLMYLLYQKALNDDSEEEEEQEQEQEQQEEQEEPEREPPVEQTPQYDDGIAQELMDASVPLPPSVSSILEEAISHLDEGEEEAATVTDYVPPIDDDNDDDNDDNDDNDAGYSSMMHDDTVRVIKVPAEESSIVSASTLDSLAKFASMNQARFPNAPKLLKQL